MLLQLSCGVEATGGRAESEGVAHVFDFPTRPRCVDVHVIVSDAVKGSHVQRGPLSMGAQSEPGTQRSPKVKKGEIVLAHSVGDATAQVGSLLGGRFLSVPQVVPWETGGGLEVNPLSLHVGSISVGTGRVGVGVKTGRHMSRCRGGARTSGWGCLGLGAAGACLE